MIYVDTLEDRGMWAEAGGSCHLGSDTSEAELMAFGRKLGLLDEWYQANALHPHYDLSRDQRVKAIVAGARVVGNVEFARQCSRIFNPAIEHLSGAT